MFMIALYRDAFCCVLENWCEAKLRLCVKVCFWALMFLRKKRGKTTFAK